MNKAMNNSLKTLLLVLIWFHFD